MEKRRIYIDFDGVITNYENGWQGHHVCNDTRNDEIHRWFWSISTDFEFVVLSGRALTWRGRRCIRWWLKDNGYPPLRVTCKKAGDYIFYIDDRGWSYRKGHSVLPSRKEVNRFQPWCKEEQIK